MALPVHFYDFWGATLFVLICDSFSLAKTMWNGYRKQFTYAAEITYDRIIDELRKLLL